MGNPRYDADELRGIVESRLRSHGLKGSDLAEPLAQELAARLDAIAGRIVESVVAHAIEVKAEDVLAAATSQPQPETGSRETLRAVRDAVRALEAGGSQVDILRALIDGSAAFCKRAALFIVKADPRGDKAIGWLAHGFGSSGPFTDENIKKVSVPLSAETFFKPVYSSGSSHHGAGEVSGDNRKFFERIGAFVPREILAEPLVIKGKVVAILYGDGGSEGDEIASPEAVAALVAVAAMSIRLIPLKGQESSGEGVRRPGTTEAPIVPVRTGPVSAPAPAVAAPAPVASAAGPALSAEERKVHDEARRFARLLVSEIKLYNEAKVAVGRKNRDLYERLKEDIERSRQMYNERISAKVTSTTNYFFEELVSQLADGDRATLGI